MEYSLFSKEKVNRCKKKVIPWHVQKRYMENLSQLSFNQTIATAFYKKEINSLKRNNKHLALALQQTRYLATEKENLILENGKILDIVNFSRLKLMDMATNMKQATAYLDETLLLLNSAKDNISKCSPNNQNRRNEFKNKLLEINIEPIKEVMESTSKNLNSLNKNDLSYVHKGKLSRVDDCIFPPNKKCKLGNKEEKVKKNNKDVPKSTTKSSALSNAAFKNSSVKNTEKCGSVHNIKSRRKKSSTKSSDIESPSSSKFPTASSNGSLHGKNEQIFQEKKCKAVKVMLTDIAESFLKLENRNSSKTNELVSSMNGTSLKCFPQNSDKDNILIKTFISSKISSEASFGMNSCSPPLVSTINGTEVHPSASAINDEMYSFASTIDDAEVHSIFSTTNNDEVCPLDPIYETEVPISSQNTSNSSNFSSADDIPVIREDLPALQSKENEVWNNTEQNNKSCIKNSDLEKIKRSCKSPNSTIPRKVHFYFDEDSIESADRETTTSKNKRIHKNLNKCKARKSVSDWKKNTYSKSATIKSNCILPDNVSKLGKNSFLVTAEVHSPPNTVHHAKEMKGKLCFSEKREPRVVLTDIFKSNQGLLSEMVGNSLYENGCFEQTVTSSANATLDSIPVTDSNANYMDCENSAVDCHLLEHQAIIKKVFCQGKSEESKKNWKKQSTVVLKDVNCKKALKKGLKVYSNKKDRINFASYLSDDKENRCLLPADRNIIEEKRRLPRSKVVSYKEPSLHTKMRRLR